MPKKYFHIVSCPLSKRQRFLYEDYIGRRNTKEQLASGSFLSMMGVLMQLRKVCNHPDLFETRPINSPFICEKLDLRFPRRVLQMRVRGRVRSHSLNQAIFKTNDLTDGALEEMDWRQTLQFFPEDCRNVSMCEEALFCELEDDCVLSSIMRDELKPKPQRFVEEVCIRQGVFSPCSELLKEIEESDFNYHFGGEVESNRLKRI